MFVCPDCGSDSIDLNAYEDRLLCRQCGCAFPKINVFFSYRHELYTDQIARIMDRLAEKGFYTWIDRRIEHMTPSWRSALRKAVVRADAVLAFVSKGYLDSPVCNDELRIAACGNIHSIRTVLLENDESVLNGIPEFVSDPQRFDISDWIQGGCESPEGDRRLDAIVEHIAARLTDPENRKTQVAMAALKNRLNPYLPLYKNENNTGIFCSGREIILRKEDALKDASSYCGREWLADECERWRRKGARSLLLYGRPGIGKSTFIAHYIRDNPYCPAAYFCKWDDKEQSTARVIIRTVAYQLAQSFPEYRDELTDFWRGGAPQRQEKETLELALLGRTSVPTLFHSLITEPLIRCQFSDRKERYAIVIDALNEMDPDELDQLSQALYQEQDQLPECLCFLFTSQTTDDVAHLCRFMSPVTISAGDEDNLRDIRDYTEKNLTHGLWDEKDRRELVDRICEKSEGIFLYAAFVVRGINAGTFRVSLAEGDSLDGLPENLSFAIRRYMLRIAPDRQEFEEKYKSMLSMICVSPEPLPGEDLKKALSVSRGDMEDRLARFAPFLNRQTVDGIETVSLAHQSYYRWFTDRKLSDSVYHCPEDRGCLHLADYFLSYYRRQWPKRMSLYLLRNFIRVLEKCGDDKLDDLIEVLDDTAFLRFAVKKLYDLGQIAQSNRLCLEAIDAAKRIRGKNMYTTLAAVQLRLALNYANQGKLSLGRELLMESEEKYLPRIPEASALAASTYSNIAWTAREDNLLELAETYIKKALGMFGRMGCDAESENAKADIKYVEGSILFKRYRQAEGQEKERIFEACRKALEESVSIWKALGEEDDDVMLQITFSHMTMAWLYLNSKEYRRALEEYREILRIRERIFRENPDSLYIAKALGNVANACVKIMEAEKDGRYLEEAASACDRAISIYTRTHSAGDADYNVAVVLITQGDILRLQNDRTGAAHAYRKALEILGHYGESKRGYITQTEEKLMAVSGQPGCEENA